MRSSPHQHGIASVAQDMQLVLLGMVPAALLLFAWFGPGVLFNLILATGTALAAEAGVLWLRKRNAKPTLLDFSAVVTAVILALALPYSLPWWMVIASTLFAIVIGKQLFGGLGYNPFNPAMLGYVMLLVSFPLEMTQWLPAVDVPGNADWWSRSLLNWGAGSTPIDQLTAATPLDHVRTSLLQGRTLSEVEALPTGYGLHPSEWISLAFLGGGLWLMYKKVISWHIPISMLLSLWTLSFFFHAMDADAYATPMFHLFHGATMFCAFFIATDPVSAATTPKGRILFGAGIGALVFVIRTWGGYPDAVAFAVLLMNMTAPLIDYYTRPRVFGTSKSK
jgi:electron transport complex protein RnfD